MPDLNPDGLAARTRWSAASTSTATSRLWRASRRAGAAPASETETRVAMRLIRQLRPHVTIWFHQPQALVRATGRSVGIARRYARLAGGASASVPRPPGSATEWRAALPGTRAFVVELPPGALGLRDAGRYVDAAFALAD